MPTIEATPEPSHVAEARYLGHDAALAAATWVEMNEADARSVLDDVDPEVMDRYAPPNLSGQWADDPTPATLHHEIVGRHITSDRDSNVAEEIADAWCEAVDAAWADALQAHALRVLGRIEDAQRVEAALEAEADRLRELRQ